MKEKFGADSMALSLAVAQHDKAVNQVMTQHLNRSRDSGPKSIASVLNRSRDSGLKPIASVLKWLVKMHEAPRLGATCTR